jgi:hypothetical protein
MKPAAIDSLMPGEYVVDAMPGQDAGVPIGSGNEYPEAPGPFLSLRRDSAMLYEDDPDVDLAGEGSATWVFEAIDPD